MAKSISTRPSGPGEVSRPKVTKWRKTSVRKQAAANQKRAAAGMAKKRKAGY